MEAGVKINESKGVVQAMKASYFLPAPHNASTI